MRPLVLSLASWSEALAHGAAATQLLAETSCALWKLQVGGFLFLTLPAHLRAFPGDQVLFGMKLGACRRTHLSPCLCAQETELPGTVTIGCPHLVLRNFNFVCCAEWEINLMYLNNNLKIANWS